MPTPFDRYLDEAGSAGTPFDAFIRPDASRQAPPGVDSHATAAVGGVYSGLADMLGAPVDAAAWGLGKIPGLDVPGDAVGGSESMRRAFGLIPGVAPSESALERRLGRELTAGERFTYRPAQEVGAALIPAAGVLGLAARGVRAAKPAGNAFVRALRDVVDTTRRAPAATTAAELGLAATAGAGAQAAREVAPDSPTAEFAGAMAGGVAPAALLRTPVPLAARGVAKAMKSMAPKAVKRAATRDVARTMADQMTPEATARLREADALRETIPGFEPTLGEATGSPSILAAQRDIEGKASGAELDALARRREANIGAVDSFAQERAPLGGNRPLYVVDTARERVAALGEAVAREVGKLHGRREDLAAGLPQADRAGAGRGLRDRLTALRRQASERMNRRAEELGINDAEVEVDFASIADDLGDEFAPRSIFEDRKNVPEVVKLIDDIARQDREAAEAAAVMAIPKGPPPAPARGAGQADSGGAPAGAEPGRTATDSARPGEPIARISGTELAPLDAPFPVLRQRAEDWYNTNLVDTGATVTNVHDGRVIQFEAAGAGRTGAAGEDILRMVSAIPDMLRFGRLLDTKPDRQRRGNLVAWHRYTGTVDVGGQRRNITLTVRERTDGTFHYSLHRKIGGTGAGSEGPRRIETRGQEANRPYDSGPGPARNIARGSAEFNPRTVTFRDLKLLRERVGDDLRDAMSAANPSRKAIRTLTALRERLDGVIDDTVRTADPDLADNYRTFRQEYFDAVIEPFEQGAAFEVRARDGRGFYRTPDEQVMRAFFAPGDVTAARQFKRVFAGDGEAMQALAATAMDSLRQAAVRDGVVQPRLLEAWIRRHRSVLDELPELSRSVASVQSANDALLARAGQLEARRKLVQDSLLMRRISWYVSGATTAEGVIAGAVRDPRLMRNLVSSVRGEPDAMMALRRHVWDTAIDLPPDRLRTFMRENGLSLRQVLSRRHMMDLDRIQRARAMIANSAAPGGGAPRPMDAVTRLGDVLGTPAPQIESRTFAAASGRTSFRWVANMMLFRFMRQRSLAAREALFREALYNPEVARELAAMTMVGRVPAARARRLNAWLFNAGLGTTREDDRPGEGRR